jgi:hypothetical protein
VGGIPDFTDHTDRLLLLTQTMSTMTTKQIDGIVCFQHMRDALDAAIALNEAGFDTEILWEAIDDYSDAGFMKVARYADCDTDTALDAFHDQVEALVDPFDGWLDEWGFS